MPTQMLATRFIDQLCDTARETAALPSAILIAAHPDDEVIGAGACLPRIKHAHFVQVTDGAPCAMRDAHAAGCATREAYAALRRGERLAALAVAGIPPAQAVELNIMDQRASFQLVTLANAIKTLLNRHAPQLVITHAYEGGHPDHDATAFAVHAACALLRAEDVEPPMIVEMTSYHNGPDGITVGTFLPGGDGDVTTKRLTGEERAFKRALFDCFPSQRQVLQPFSRDVERFRPAPCYDFTQPPHDGTLFYDQFDWGVTSRAWRQLARAAQTQLQCGRAG